MTFFHEHFVHVFAALPREQHVLDWPSCGRCAAKFYFSEGAFGVNASRCPLGPGQVRPLPVALGRALDFGSGQVQFEVVTELEKLACLHGRGDVLDAEEFSMAKRRLIQA